VTSTNRRAASTLGPSTHIAQLLRRYDDHRTVQPTIEVDRDGDPAACHADNEYARLDQQAQRRELALGKSPLA
jgi:hypothetical protein